MLKVGRNFQFEIPDVWEAARDGDRWIFHGPSAGELIVTSLFVEGEGSPSERKHAEVRLLDQALIAADEAARQDGLRIVEPLAQKKFSSGIPSWSFVSEAIEEDILFTGAVFQHRDGVLFATLEGPNSPNLLMTFQQFAGSVRPPITDSGGA